jgi:hypothetical protein
MDLLFLWAITLIALNVIAIVITPFVFNKTYIRGPGSTTVTIAVALINLAFLIQVIDKL